MSTPSVAQTEMKIAAIVNDEVISGLDLHARLLLTIKSSRLEATQAVFSRLAPVVLRNLIDEKLKVQEAKKLNIIVSEAEVLDALASIGKRNNIAPGKVDAFLASQGIDKNELLKQIRSDIAWIRLIRRKSLPNIKISEEEINSAIQEIKQNAGKPEHQVSEIFLPVDKPERQGEVLQLAEKLIQQLRSGATFRALARSFSQSSTAAVGGDLGWVRKGQLPEEVEKALAEMTPGAMSAPIRTISGYYIIVLRNQRLNPGFGNREDTLVLSQLFLPVSANAPQAEIASKTSTADSMRNSARNCNELDNLGKKLGNRQTGRLGEVKLSKLPAAVRSLVAKLPINQSSQPKFMNGGIVVLMVCDRKTIKIDIDERRRVREQLVSQRLKIAARQIFRDLKRTAFVDIRL